MTTMADTLSDKLKADGYLITPPPENTRGDHLWVTKGSDCVAVLVKEHKAKVSVPTVQVFQEYLGLDAAKRYTRGGWLISASGFFNTALTHVKTEEPANLRLGTFSSGILKWDYGGIGSPSPPPPPPIKAKLRYFGIFTCKGGVGKTTVAAAPGRRICAMGFDVVLVDLDPDKNLRKLFRGIRRTKTATHRCTCRRKGGGTGRRSRSSTTTSGTRGITRTSRSSSATALRPLGEPEGAGKQVRLLHHPDHPESARCGEEGRCDHPHVRAHSCDESESRDVRPDQRLRRNTGRGEKERSSADFVEEGA